MIINNKHVQGIFLYSPNVEYEKGDFVVYGDSIYICTAANPTNPETFTVMGVNPETDSTGNYKIYPGDKISTVQEYYDYVNNKMYWKFKDTKEEVEVALGVEAGGLIVLGSFSNRDDLPTTRKEGDVYRVGTSSTGYEYAYIPYKEDKYISGNILNQILQSAYFGVNESGVITNHIYTDVNEDGVLQLDYSIGGTLANIEDDKILNAIIKSPDLNNGMFNVSRSLPEISGFVNLDSNVETVLVRQYTYADNKLGNRRIRIQELVDPESSMVYYRWSEGIGVSLNQYDQNRPYHLNDVAFYKDKAWISNENSNVGHTPGTDSWWSEFSGEWSYENITAWTSSFSAGASKISAQLDSIKAFYTKKVAELEATKKQLTGAFCNREVDLEDQNQSSVRLTAGDNVRMHSSWEFIEGDEEDLLQNLQVSSLSDILTLFSSVNQVDSLLNTSNLDDIIVVVKVGTSNNFTYSYSRYGQPWQHGNTMSTMLSNLGKSSLADVFEVGSDVYNYYPELEHPDFPFTIILKDQVSGEMKVTLYTPYTGTWNLTGRNLFDQVEINKRISSIYYEDLAFNDEIIGVADINYDNDIHTLVGNSALVETIEPGVSATTIPLPMILPVFNSTSPFLLKTSFAEPLLYKENNIPEYDGSDYKIGSMVFDVVDSNKIVYIATTEIESGISPTREEGNGWMEFGKYIELFNRWKSYFGIPGDKTSEYSTTTPILELLYEPYPFKNCLWESLILGPSPRIKLPDTEDKYIEAIYPVSTIIVDDDGAILGKTTKTFLGSDSEFDSYLLRLDEGDIFTNYTPIYDKIFYIDEFKTALKSLIDDGGKGVIELGINDPSVFSYLSDTVGNRRPTGFFCIIYPIFSIDNKYSRFIIDGELQPSDSGLFSIDNAYYCFFDINLNVAYLKPVNNLGLLEGILDDNYELYSENVKDFLDYVLGRYSNSVVSAINAFIDNSSINHGINNNLRISDLGGLPKLNLFFNVEYRGGSLYDSKFPVTTYMSTAYSTLSMSSITPGSPNYTNITFSSDTHIPARLGICTLTTSKLKGDAINLIVKLGSDPNKDYDYYVSNININNYLISTLENKFILGDSIENPAVFFNPEDTYNEGDEVIYCNQRWVSKISNNSRTPYPESNEWVVISETDYHKCGIFEAGLSDEMINYYKVSTEFLGEERSDITYGDGGIVLRGNAYYTTGSQSQQITSIGAIELEDTRLNVVLNRLGVSNLSIEEDSREVLDKVLLSVKTKFKYIVLSDGVYYSIYNGTVSSIPGFIPTNENILSESSFIGDTTSIQATNGFYIPPTLVRDISSDRTYSEEYKIMYNNQSTRKTDDDWVTGAGPLERLLMKLTPTGESPIPNILSGITEVDPEIIVNYSIPVRTVCVENREESNKVYFVNGNYWVRGNHPANDSEYIRWNDNTNILGQIPSTFNELPDAFSLGKIYVVFGVGNQSEEWYVVQNPDWLTIDLQNGGFYDKNRKSIIKRWWLSTNRDYECSEEVLFDILHTNFVVNTSSNETSINPKYKGILWSSTYKYVYGDIVIYHGEPYNQTKTYNTGSIVIVSGTLWKAKVNGITGTWDETKWEDLGISDFSLWKCINSNIRPGEVPGSTSGWEIYGDPLYNTLSYTPSKTVLMNNVNPSVPFILITKVGTTSNYLTAVNSRMMDFNTPCITTVLLQQTTQNNLIHCYTATVDLYLGTESSMSYYITDDITLTVSSDQGSKVRILTVTGGATIKNIYYRYTI